jgi:hypothetical protein
MANKQFTAKELIEFSQLKKFVKDNTQSVLDWGDKLNRIKICEYWVLDGAPSFKEWCEEHVPLPWNAIKWALEKEHSQLARHAGEEIKQANVTTTQVNRQPSTVATNEPHEPHKPASSPQNNGAPPPTKPQKVYDDMGVEIPKGCLEVWARRDEIKELAAVVSEIKCKIERKRKEGDKLFMKICQDAITRAELFYSYLKAATPETVCGTCKGRSDVCASCQSTGLQSIEEYKRLTPREDQQIRAKAYGITRLSAGMSR